MMCHLRKLLYRGHASYHSKNHHRIYCRQATCIYLYHVFYCRRRPRYSWSRHYSPRCLPLASCPLKIRRCRCTLVNLGSPARCSNLSENALIDRHPIYLYMCRHFCMYRAGYLPGPPYFLRLLTLSVSSSLRPSFVDLCHPS